jgi:hypothetical protein
MLIEDVWFYLQTFWTLIYELKQRMCLYYKLAKINVDGTNYMYLSYDFTEWLQSTMS